MRIRRTTFILAAFLALAAWLLCGCLVATSGRVESDTWTTNKLGEATHERRVTHLPATIAWGDARLAFDKLKISNGKTHAVGVTGYEGETTTTNLPANLDGAGKLIGSAARHFLTGGAPTP